MVGTGSGSTAELNVSGVHAEHRRRALGWAIFGGTGTVNQTGGTVMVKAACPTIANCAALNIGNQGGTSTYDISGDGKLILEGGSHSIGRNEGPRPAGNGTLNISDNALVELRPSTENPVNDHGFMVIGDRSQSNVRASTTAAAPSTRAAAPSASTPDRELYLAGYGHGTYNLNGGTLEIGGNSLNGVYNNVGGSYDFNLGGGTIKVIGSAARHLGRRRTHRRHLDHRHQLASVPPGAAPSPAPARCARPGPAR